MSDLTCGHIVQLNNGSIKSPVTVDVNIRVTEDSKKEVEDILNKLERANSLYEKLAQIEVKETE